MNKTFVLIMAGGSGERLWPESRKNCPKQFLSLASDRSMLEETIERILPLVPVENVLVITRSDFVQDVFGNTINLSQQNVLAEPASRNTAPCIALAALEMIARGGHDVSMIVLPCDHYIPDSQAFRTTLEHALNLVNEDPERLLTIGVPVTSPSTEFGYIETDSPLDSPVAMQIVPHLRPCTVRLFHEKPDIETACRYKESGHFFWNSGIFVWKAATILWEIMRNEPDMSEGLLTLQKHCGQVDFSQILTDIFPRFRSISIDYAVLEHSSRVVMLPATFRWNDLGSFQSLSLCHETRFDDQKNAVKGDNVLCVQANGNIVRTQNDNQLTVLAGVDDLVVVQTESVTLICRKGEEKLIPKVLERLKQEGKTEYL